MNRAVFLGLLAGLAGSGCTSPETFAQSESRILGGELAPEATSVVGVTNFAGGQCSGSLLLPNLVLTARHCIAPIADDMDKVICGQTMFLNPDSAGAVFVMPLAEFTDVRADYRAVLKIELPPGADTEVCGSDVALLTLRAPLDAPSIVPRVDLPVEADEGYTAIGYGADEGAAVGPSGIRRQLAAQSVVCAGTDCTDVDVRPTEWEGSGGVCHGDSGGPAVDAAGRVIGVVSRGLDGCRAPIYGAVSSWADWLKSEAVRVSAESGEDPPNWALGFSSDPAFHAPVGTACEGDADCVSSHCAGGKCTRACAADGPCPSGYLCSEAMLCEEDHEELESSCAFGGARTSRGAGLAGLALGASALVALARRRQERSRFRAI